MIEDERTTDERKGDERKRATVERTEDERTRGSAHVNRMWYRYLYGNRVV
jgi:hypothetical protein